jgi:hypothetical protein
MLPKVYSLDEARDFFLTHSSGSVVCVQGELEIVCDTFVQARHFFTTGDKPCSS